MGYRHTHREQHGYSNDPYPNRKGPIYQRFNRRTKKWEDIEDELDDPMDAKDFQDNPLSSSSPLRSVSP